MVRLVDSEPTPGQVVAKLHAWIGTYADGTEGLIAGGIEGLGLVVLVASRRKTAEQMRAIAERAMAASRSERVPVVAVRLTTFNRAEDA